MSDGQQTCDYLVVGAGASGMAFVDTLLLHAQKPLSVVLLDRRAAPGGHWNDAYDYVTLHQPCTNYGVESTKLQEGVTHPELLASREQILAYYHGLLSRWQADGKHRVTFVGGAAYDFEAGAYIADGASTPVQAATVVDARYTENDVPLRVPPRFGVADGVQVIPPNELPQLTATDAAGGPERRFCVLGAGKTGQDTVLYLRRALKVPVEQLAWVMPTDPWITARDPPPPLKQHNCMELLDSCLQAHATSWSGASTPFATSSLSTSFTTTSSLTTTSFYSSSFFTTSASSATSSSLTTCHHHASHHTRHTRRRTPPPAARQWTC